MRYSLFMAYFVVGDLTKFWLFCFIVLTFFINFIYPITEETVSMRVSSANFDFAGIASEPELSFWGDILFLVHLSRRLKCTIVRYCVLLCVVRRPSSLTFHIFDFSSEAAERNSMKLDRKQDLNVLYQVCVFQVDLKTQDGRPCL